MGVSVWLLLFCVGVILQQMVVSLASVPIARRQRTVINIPEVSQDPVVYSCDNVEENHRVTCGSCTSVMLCNYQKQNVGLYDCSSIDPLLPYCKDGKCQSELGCDLKSDLCPAEDNFYPVPHNCSEAVYCNDRLQATSYSAPSTSYMFEYETGSWIYLKTPADCFQINCNTASNLNKFFTYKPYPQLYFFCGTSGPLTFKCGVSEVFNETTKNCEFGCTKKGKFPISGVKDRYYSCLDGPNGSLQKFEESCPSGKEFDAQLQLCKNKE
ncbi:uncharacterized protein LOC128718178 [Anopheles marshallii]|uniref:uncharacterized protein LOC128718178 n=1 Tax=Anopheles marshallii TaxID=1521116 RepID=UPI00237C0FE4|nr:uncharacterized protein LOC128718178 [Anopheles marshallii]